MQPPTLTNRLFSLAVIGTFTLAGGLILVTWTNAMDTLHGNPNGPILLSAFVLSLYFVTIPAVWSAAEIRDGPMRNGMAIFLAAGGALFLPAIVAAALYTDLNWGLVWLLALGLAVAGQWIGVSLAKWLARGEG